MAKNSHQVAQEVFDQQYQNNGLNAQRLYPNEALVEFIGNSYFRIPIPERKNIKILEVGCGSGANLWMMAKEGFEVHGLDSSARGLQIAEAHLREKWGVSAQLKQGSFLELPYPDGMFDAVVDVVSLQHLGLEDSLTALCEIRRILKPEGRFFSYRLSDHSVMFERASFAERLDAATLSNIADPHLPLANNGPIAFWSPVLVREKYFQSKFVVEDILRRTRTYANGALVEYLAVTASSSVDEK
jgi:ubiquinone/menaquinone biosynthesis C-methylase UbiE